MLHIDVRLRLKELMLDVPVRLPRTIINPGAKDSLKRVLGCAGTFAIEMFAGNLLLRDVFVYKKPRTTAILCTRTLRHSLSCFLQLFAGDILNCRQIFQKLLCFKLRI